MNDRETYQPLILFAVYFFQSKRNPKLFLVAAGAPLASVIISTILSYIWKSPTISVVSIFSIANLNQFPSDLKSKKQKQIIIRCFICKYLLLKILFHFLQKHRLASSPGE